MAQNYSRRSALWGLTALGVLAALPRAAEAGQKAGVLAADFSLPDSSNQATKLSELRGKVVVVDFCASWCDPCVKELPELEKLSRKLAPEGVVFLAINLDRERKNAQALLQRLQLTFKMLLDPEGKVAELYDPPKMPTTYVIDKAGFVRHINQGFDGAADIGRLEKQIAALNR